jgi:hypothetical protein
MKKSQHNRTKHKKNLKHKKTMKKRQKWVTPIDLASKEYAKTDSLMKARAIFRVQALKNARKLFGYHTSEQYKA